MTIDEFKLKLIADGIASLKKHEQRPERLRGGIAGFELCRQLNSMADFTETLEARRREELRLRGEHYSLGGKEKAFILQYWEYRYATVQIEYVFERMLVGWSQMGLYSGSLSARAVLRSAAILGVKAS